MTNLIATLEQALRTLAAQVTKRSVAGIISTKAYVGTINNIQKTQYCSKPFTKRGSAIVNQVKVVAAINKAYNSWRFWPSSHDSKDQSEAAQTGEVC
jgi:hypothetical protein